MNRMFLVSTYGGRQTARLIQQHDISRPLHHSTSYTSLRMPLHAAGQEHVSDCTEIPLWKQAGLGHSIAASIGLAIRLIDWRSSRSVSWTLLTWTKSLLGFLRPPFSGTLTIVPSTSFSSACWTPSPLTSLVMPVPSTFLAILSTCKWTELHTQRTSCKGGPLNVMLCEQLNLCSEGWCKLRTSSI